MGMCPRQKSQGTFQTRKQLLKALGMAQQQTKLQQQPTTPWWWTPCVWTLVTQQTRLKWMLGWPAPQSRKLLTGLRSIVGRVPGWPVPGQQSTALPALSSPLSFLGTEQQWRHTLRGNWMLDPVKECSFHKDRNYRPLAQNPHPG
eukprot:5591028-Amphidinium_carterae.3